MIGLFCTIFSLAYLNFRFYSCNQVLDFLASQSILRFFWCYYQNISLFEYLRHKFYNEEKDEIEQAYDRTRFLDVSGL